MHFTLHLLLSKKFTAEDIVQQHILEALYNKLQGWTKGNQAATFSNTW